MQHPRAQNENHRNLANLRATPDAKPRPSSPTNCHNHPDKPATHVLPQPHPHPQLHYCEKCSIMLASKGHNLLKLALTPTPIPIPSSVRPTRSPLRSARQA